MYRRYPQAAERFIPRVGPTRSRRLKETKKPGGEAGGVEAKAGAKIEPNPVIEQSDVLGQSQIASSPEGRPGSSWTDGQLNLPGLRVAGGSDPQEEVAPPAVRQSPPSITIFELPSKTAQAAQEKAALDAQRTLAVQNAQRGIGDGDGERADGRQIVPNRDDLAPEF